MKIFSTIKETNEYLAARRSEGKTIGFVPTMGALHEGHLELMRRARKENDILVVSIFVNPIQFNNPDDLKKYPRTLEEDIKKLEQVQCDVLFAPDAEEMYPEKVTKQYDFGELDKVMEGKFRPGHFNGVAIVVKKLFDIVQPHRAYFGEKDFQQLAIIKKLVEMENIPVEIVPCPIVREPDGLAMSSRNRLLTPEQRKEAPFIYRTLQEAKLRRQHICANPLRQMIINRFEGNEHFKLEYFDIVDDKTLQPIHAWNNKVGTVACVAVWLGKVRLIDNIRII
ncbi:pantoate--beta-alanine ligase [Candidatus Sulfidibacterium hydrothermale]|uniref:pantoate--beta-alanine ligase n=1 Tax=Candidatus Sulfidibacterium hydrothermale TaxID=2875962 RepID=UPI001F0A2B39|nr:pantoate--beta-alanine ligase [Candidatus Sulfidibacterium hydrothermale]UBM62146.1 pantoate--beta-alanine ligase [Candidatus Sulfidibacterium hydrothermale]